MRNHRWQQIIAVFAFLLSSACSAQDATTTPPAPTAAPKSTSTPTTPPQPPATATPAAIPFEIVQTITGDSDPLSEPIDVAFDTKGNLFVLEAGASRVQEFDSQGKSLRSWGSAGSEPGQFKLELIEKGKSYGYGAIAVDTGDNILVADALNRRVQKFDERGKFLMQWGSQGTGEGQFLRALSLTVDAAGHIYVIDDRRDDIQEFDSQGKFIKMIGEHGNSNGQFGDTGDMTLGPDGDIYVADYGNRRIEVLSGEGQFVRSWRTSYPPVGIAVNNAGNVFVTDDNSFLTEYDPAGKTIQMTSALGLSDPVGIQIDSNGLIYVADQHNNRVLVLREK
jgi:tripartite motif-containing protein 71